MGNIVTEASVAIFGVVSTVYTVITLLYRRREEKLHRMDAYRLILVNIKHDARIVHAWKPIERIVVKPTETSAPRLGTLLLRFTLKAKDQESVLGDLEELYHTWRTEHSATIARLLYDWHVIRTFAATLSGKLIKSAVIITIGRFIKHIISS